MKDTKEEDEDYCTYYFLFFQVASATATRYGLSRGVLGLEYDGIHIYDSDSSVRIVPVLSMM